MYGDTRFQVLIGLAGLADRGNEEEKSCLFCLSFEGSLRPFYIFWSGFACPYP